MCSGLCVVLFFGLRAVHWAPLGGRVLNSMGVRSPTRSTQGKKGRRLFVAACCFEIHICAAIPTAFANQQTENKACEVPITLQWWPTWQATSASSSTSLSTSSWHGEEKAMLLLIPWFPSVSFVHSIPVRCYIEDMHDANAVVPRRANTTRRS